MLTKDVKEMEESKRKKEVAKFAKSLACIDGGKISLKADSLINECADDQRTTEEALKILLDLHTEK